MNITPRPYAGIHDLKRIQAATAEWINLAGLCGYLHIGDIALRLFNGMRLYQPEEIVRLWSDSDSTVLGWAIIYPRWSSYEAALHPAHRNSELETQIVDWCEQEIETWLIKEKRSSEPVNVEVFAEDSVRVALLEKRGYRLDAQHDVVSERSLSNPIPDANLPVGFNTRRLEGEAEVAQLIEVMNASFGWSWTEESYLLVMRSPAYQSGYSFVVVAPDDRFASFCFVMLDYENKLGMIEDVGTHPVFRGQGLGKAMLYEAMKRLKAEGMKTALIPYNTKEVPAAKLYESAGFQSRYSVWRYVKSGE